MALVSEPAQAGKQSLPMTLLARGCPSLKLPCYGFLTQRSKPGHKRTLARRLLILEECQKRPVRTFYNTWHLDAGGWEPSTASQAVIGPPINLLRFPCPQTPTVSSLGAFPTPTDRAGGNITKEGRPKTITTGEVYSRCIVLFRVSARSGHRHRVPESPHGPPLHLREAARDRSQEPAYHSQGQL